MAVDLSALATATQYRAATGDRATGTDATLNAQLVGVTRALERGLHVAPGGFTEHTATYLFPSLGGTRLWLRDRAGMAYFLQSAEVGGIDADGVTFDLGDDFVRGLPENAVTQNEAYRSLELLPARASSIAEWPIDVSINGTWGLPSDSEWLQLLADLVVHRTKELRDAAKGGPTQDLAGLDGGLPLGRQTAWMFKEIEALVGRRLPVMSLGAS